MQTEIILRQFGFEIEHFGGREYCISAVPSNLYGLTEEELFPGDAGSVWRAITVRILWIFLLQGWQRWPVRQQSRVIIPFIYGGSREADLDELITLENPYHCPHGRPTIISMTKTELEKKFKRIV